MEWTDRGNRIGRSKIRARSLQQFRYASTVPNSLAANIPGKLNISKYYLVQNLSHRDDRLSLRQNRWPDYGDQQHLFAITTKFLATSKAFQTPPRPAQRMQSRHPQRNLHSLHTRANLPPLKPHLWHQKQFDSSPWAPVCSNESSVKNAWVKARISSKKYSLLLF